MSKATLEAIAKAHAQLSDLYEELASNADEDEPTPPAKGKGKAAPADDPDGDLPPPKSAGTKGKAAAPAKGKKAAPAEEYTVEDVINAATELIKATNRDTAVKIIKKHGGEKVADLDEDVYADVIAAFKAAMPSDSVDDI